ncbi:MAG TPA: peptidoglycan DD-metalloendopeptidase family protein [Puia sp.]|uniref:peptidoglycan DD-metalloendopeptidase family protein n=1 Tax=Puia sp. TaxID=2045100 RepID=UPI002C1A6027|nr:peptidoglycan DD-metalloendopeptidase family protein [Puia sp.]HVU99137.1 peptidoglycan DD-metalloendopeptidase family protein [Puia sp.]
MSSCKEILQRHRADFHRVVPFDPGRDKLYPFDFTGNNTALSPDEIADTERLAAYITSTLKAHQARYGIGGYGEHRTLYARSKHFDQGEEPRRLHLGIDIWGPAGTKVMAPLDGFVHSFAFNNNDSDYGATLILTHHLEGEAFHTLYGHLSLNSIKNLYEHQRVSKGEVIAEFGMRFENGNWPPHLHFQLIKDMQDWKGDYPGVCRFSERQQWLANCPDPDLILQMQA